jgi:hypothetical protein
MIATQRCSMPAPHHPISAVCTATSDIRNAATPPHSMSLVASERPWSPAAPASIASSTPIAAAAMPAKPNRCP